MKYLNKAGETIVEVLMVVLMLGTVLTTAFVATGRSNTATQASQERSEAAAYGQTQIERLKNLLANSNVALTGNFCIDNTNTVVTGVSTATGGCADGSYLRYSSYIAFDSTTQTYTEHVLWDRAGGTGQENLQLAYRTGYLADATSLGGSGGGGGSGGSGGGSGGSGTVFDPCPASSVPTGYLRACYYNDISFGRFVMSRPEYPQPGGTAANVNATDVLNDNFGLGSPGSGVDTDDFSARYEGNFNFNAGVYTFNAGADDGVRLYIDGTLVIDQFHQQGFTMYQAVKGFATAGLHTVRVDYYENRGYAAVRLFWNQNAQLPRTGLIWTNTGGSSVSAAEASTGRNYCYQIDETAEPGANSWMDNYLCSDQNLGLQWSHAGPISGMYCNRWYVPSDPYTWTDNYLCSPTDIGLTFSASGPIAGQACITINEPNDLDGGGLWVAGTPQLCETTAAPPTLVEAETFKSLYGGSGPMADGSASANATQVFYTNDTITRTVSLPAFNSIVVRARGDQYNGAPNMVVTIDGTPVLNNIAVSNTSYATFAVNTAAYGAGNHTINMSFTNDAWCGFSCASQDRNLYIDYISFSPNKL